MPANIGWQEISLPRPIIFLLRLHGYSHRHPSVPIPFHVFSVPVSPRVSMFSRRRPSLPDPFGIPKPISPVGILPILGVAKMVTTMTMTILLYYPYSDLLLLCLCLCLCLAVPSLNYYRLEAWMMMMMMSSIDAADDDADVLLPSLLA